LQSSRVIRIATPPRDFSVLDTAKFVVLHPEIALEDFGCSRKPENGSVSLVQTTVLGLTFCLSAKPRCVLPISAPPTVALPAATLFRNERRLAGPFKRLTTFLTASSLSWL
jgi:hypothetical protein